MYKPLSRKWMISASSVYPKCLQSVWEFKNQPVEFFIDRTIRYQFSIVIYLNITAPELCIFFLIFYLLLPDALWQCVAPVEDFYVFVV